MAVAFHTRLPVAPPSHSPYQSPAFLTNRVIAHPHPPVPATAASSAQTAKSPARLRRPENVPGDFFVDHTCIDCDTCRWMAPKTFTRMGHMSAVHNQPSSSEERIAALQALLSCPTASIRTEKPPADILEAQSTFPLLIDESLPGLYHCGYHSEKSFAATSYFIARPDGNILIDSPKFQERLARRIEMMGGIRYMFLSHRDDVADHDRWQKRFNCERILHKEEVRPNTADVEIKLEGTGPWTIGSDIDLIFTPGHTEGSVCLFYKPKRVLFTGDHLCKAQDDSRSLVLSRVYNWYSVPLQIESIQALIPLDFIWILPGHGRRISFNSVEQKNAAIMELVARETS